MMRRLIGNDAVFIYSETPTTPMHTLKISIFHQPEQTNLDAAKAHFNSVIHRIPSLRWRILPVPFGLHHPVAVEDPEFDIDFHLRHVALPRPGTMRQFEDMVGQIATHALDRHRPLWELWMVDGLENDRLAFVLKLHHAMADGSASVHLFTQLISEAFDAEPPPWNPPPLPTSWQLVRQAVLSHARHDAKRFPDFVRLIMQRRKAVKLHREHVKTLAVDSIAEDIPHCRFNGALTTQRKFATTSHSLATIKTLKTELRGTINDVVLALIAGALRSYLQHYGDSTEQPLIATIPVSADQPGTVRLFGNNFSQLGTRLYISIEDPIERFNKIRESTNAGKSELEVFGKSTWPELMNYLPPFMYSWQKRREYNKQMARNPKYAVFANVAISNVPGPREKLVSSDTELEYLYSVGPLMEGNGLNITVWSYVDQLNYSIISCKKLVPDPYRIAQAIDAELIALQAAAGLDAKPLAEVDHQD